MEKTGGKRRDKAEKKKTITKTPHCHTLPYIPVYSLLNEIFLQSVLSLSLDSTLSTGPSSSDGCGEVGQYVDRRFPVDTCIGDGNTLLEGCRATLIERGDVLAAFVDV